MGVRWSSIVVDAEDPPRLARWWAEVLGYRVVVEEPGQVAVARDEETYPGLVFVPGGRSGTGTVTRGKNRLHLDLAPDDQTAEIERLVDMGARHVDVGSSGDARCTVLADPEGNEFGVLASPLTGRVTG